MHAARNTAATKTILFHQHCEVRGRCCNHLTSIGIKRRASSRVITPCLKPEAKQTVTPPPDIQSFQETRAAVCQFQPTQTAIFIVRAMPPINSSASAASPYNSQLTANKDLQHARFHYELPDLAVPCHALFSTKQDRKATARRLATK